MRVPVLLILFLLSTALHAQELSIIPKPVKAVRTKGSFVLSKNTRILITDEEERRSAAFLNDYLSTYYGFSLKIVHKASSGFIQLSTKRFIKPPENEGRYEMSVSPASIRITGDAYAGTFYGMQTLLQLLPVPAGDANLKIPAVTIADYPRFKYRGLHLDVCRHFFPVSYIKKYIDYIALHKMNYFHWHLTEDQGWRIEIKKYPLLTSVGGCRNGTITGRFPGTGNTDTKYCGYYTQDEIREVVRYAADRYITIIPEIDMPGHASAAIAAYPQLSCFPDEATKHAANSPWSGDSTGKQVQQTWGVFEDVFCPTEYTFGFLEDVLDEVMQLFPSTYIHIGGDECPKTNWKRSEFCQQLVKDKDLKDEHGLQSYFIQRIEQYVNSKGRKVIGWDEILEGGLAPNATVMSWRGETGGIAAASADHQVIMTPLTYLYLDHRQNDPEDSLARPEYLPLEKTYSYEPVSDKLPPGKEKYIWGAQANVWTEYIPNTSKLEYTIFPRVSALSELLWTPKGERNFKDFEKRLPAQRKRYKLWGASSSL